MDIYFRHSITEDIEPTTFPLRAKRFAIELSASAKQAKVDNQRIFNSLLRLTNFFLILLFLLVQRNKFVTL